MSPALAILHRLAPRPLSHRGLFRFDSHLQLTRDPAFTDNLLFWLLEQPRPSPPLAAQPVPAAPGDR